MAIRDIAGNGGAKSIMLSYCKGGKHGTSFMVRGESGTGKTFAALQFAKALNCLMPADDGDCCDACANCLSLERVFGSLDEDGFQKNPHPDAFFVNTEKAQLSVEVMRTALEEAASYAPLNLKKKIVIVKDAERMNQAAGNAILKRLEEPKDYMSIILVVNAAEKLLPTIISRCQTIDMKRAGTDSIRQALKKAGKYGVDTEKALLFCEGRIGLALDHTAINESVSAAAALLGRCPWRAIMWRKYSALLK